MLNPLVDALDKSIQEMKTRMSSWSDIRGRARESLANAENNVQQCLGAISAYEHMKAAFQMPSPAPVLSEPEPVKEPKEAEEPIDSESEDICTNCI